MAHDASHYLLIPGAVVTPDSAEQVAALFAASGRQGVPLTFRSGGTSLSGQAVTSGVLVDTRRNFSRVEVLDSGARVRVQPGVTVGQVNVQLARYGRKLGPDPASAAACTIGGVVANNSSGMSCGTEFNTYKTLDSVVVVLPSGTVVDTGAVDADARLLAAERVLYEGLIGLRDRVRGNAESCATIVRQFRMKNTMGYGINSFVDHSTPAQMLAHLIVGSEGTLGFIAEATFRTVPVSTHTATGLLVFEGLREATDALPDLVAAGFATVELMDATSLTVAQANPTAGAVLRGIKVRAHAALLVEFQETSVDELTARMGDAGSLLASLPLAQPAVLSDDVQTRAGLWHVRNGLYAAVAGARPTGTTALLEDIAVPVPVLADTCESLLKLFDRHEYRQSVIFGHAKDGNVHFLLNERFGEPARLAKYLQFTEEMVELVLGNGGTLKAEHGTGRIMAPFVRRQYGDELYEVMQSVKKLFDPHLVLNPGVLLNDDPRSHIADLKQAPEVEVEVDRCVECGYCEPVCPSRNLTLTPRQRIVLRRELARAVEAGDVELVRELEQDYRYEGLDTCAVDGMCQTACPVQINTGEMVKRLRAEHVGKLKASVWKLAAKHWGGSLAAAGAAMDVAGVLPPRLVTGASDAGRAVVNADTVPRWEKDLPRGGSRRHPVGSGPSGPSEAVYFPACVASMFAPADGGEGVSAAFLSLCERAGVQLTSPEAISSMCCGMVWRSKGLTEGFAQMRSRVLPPLWEASRGGELPVVCDGASCTEGLQQMVASGGAAYAGLRVIDAVDFIDGQLLERLTVPAKIGSLALHPTCSSTRIGSTPALLRIAALVAEEVFVADGWGCCAFAGDRGLLHPELTASATAAEAAAVLARSFDAYASTNRTCELGMTRATGHQYQHLIEVLEAAVAGSAPGIAARP
jgi:D-lactate dehydrogenase